MSSKRNIEHLLLLLLVLSAGCGVPLEVLKEAEVQNSRTPDLKNKSIGGEDYRPFENGDGLGIPKFIAMGAQSTANPQFVLPRAFLVDPESEIQVFAIDNSESSSEPIAKQIDMDDNTVAVTLRTEQLNFGVTNIEVRIDAAKLKIPGTVTKKDFDVFGVGFSAVRNDLPQVDESANPSAEEATKPPVFQGWVSIFAPTPNTTFRPVLRQQIDVGDIVQR